MLKKLVICSVLTAFGILPSSAQQPPSMTQQTQNIKRKRRTHNVKRRMCPSIGVHLAFHVWRFAFGVHGFLQPVYTPDN